MYAGVTALVLAGELKPVARWTHGVGLRRYLVPAPSSASIETRAIPTTLTATKPTTSSSPGLAARPSNRRLRAPADCLQRARERMRTGRTWTASALAGPSSSGRLP